MKDFKEVIGEWLAQVIFGIVGFLFLLLIGGVIYYAFQLNVEKFPEKTETITISGYEVDYEKALYCVKNPESCEQKFY